MEAAAWAAGAGRAEKDRATLVAEFALAGFELVQLADGTYLAQRWGMFRPLRDAGEAREFLGRVAGKA